jgi:hypothetical protein
LRARRPPALSALKARFALCRSVPTLIGASGCVDRLERARVLDPADKSEDAQAIHEQIEALRREQAGHGSDKPGP